MTNAPAAGRHAVMGGSTVDCLQGWQPLPATYQPAEDKGPAGGIRENLVEHFPSRNYLRTSDVQSLEGAEGLHHKAENVWLCIQKLATAQRM